MQRRFVVLLFVLAWAIPKLGFAVAPLRVIPTDQQSSFVPPLSPVSGPADPSGAAPAVCSITFSDVPPSNPFYPFIQTLACNGILGGYSDGTYRIGNPITRGQAAKLLANAAVYSDVIPSSRQTFSDVPTSNPFWLYIERVSAHGAISGYADGTFRPGSDVTRAQLAKIIANVALLSDPIPANQQSFSDVPNTSPFWLYVERMYGHGLISGYTCGEPPAGPCDPLNRPAFLPAAAVTRGQTAKFVANTFFPDQQVPPAVTIRVDRSSPVGVTHLAVGVTHTQYSADPANDPTAVAAAQQLLQTATHFQNQHLMGWGADNPEPAPGVYDWSSLDARIALIRQTGGTPVLTLCCAPDWMKGGAPGSTDWSQLEKAPYPEHFADFAALAQQVARRYPDVQYFQVWNELKGFWNEALNRWDYEGYTALYNQVYDALKAVNPALRVGGPYVVMDSGSDPSTMSNPSAIHGPYGTLDQRPLDVLSYWLAHKHGADFVIVDAGTDNADGVSLTDEFTATQKYADVAHWVEQQTALPLWWAEWYSTPWDHETFDHNHQNAVMATSLLVMAQSGAAAALRWQPQGEAEVAYQGDTESLWSDTRVAGGGQAFPYYYTARAFHDWFPPGTPVYAATASSPHVRVLASLTHTLLINTTPGALAVNVNGTLITLAGFEVRLLALP